MSETEDGNWTVVSISRKRLNGLKLRAEKENRKTANMLDTLLLNAGISELTDHELEKGLKKLGREVVA